MSLFSSLLNAAEKQVERYGAQYRAFAIFGLINYPISYLYELSTNASQHELSFRIIATILCFVLFFKDKWPNNLKKYLPLYWYATITIVLPVFATFILLRESFSLNWLVNFNLGIMTLIFLLDSIAFLFITSLGIIIGAVLFYSAGYSIQYLAKNEDLSLFLYMFLCIVVIGTIFTRNKEIFNHYLQKTKDDLNASLEIKVKERTKELEKALSAKTEFLNNMSHEIRTPVLGFTTISEGLVENWDILNNDKKLKYAKDVANSAERLGSLISNILDLSTFVSSKMQLDLSKFDLNNLVKDIINEMNILYADINIKYNAKPNLLVKADREWIAQALRHLFSNAVQFNYSEGLITVSIKKEDNKLHFIITDSGVGIPESELEAIFAPFYQSSRTKTKAGGRGLGLTIAKEIIEAHKGKIWAENNAQAGASFHFIIPSLS